MHVSGHGYQEDLKLMITLMKPKYFIPIHGEYRMLYLHRKLAEAVGVEGGNTYIINNGDVVDIQNGEARQTRKATAGDTYVDGYGIGEVGQVVLPCQTANRMRRCHLLVPFGLAKSPKLPMGPNTWKAVGGRTVPAGSTCFRTATAWHKEKPPLT